jgi:hypothetical protein
MWILVYPLLAISDVQGNGKFNIPACIDMERNLGAGGGDVGGISRWAESEMGDIFSVFG